jgi:hypothetical protein
VHPLHAPLLIVLLFLPNTTWRDWSSANAPHLHQILQTGSVALMSDRTAERDSITPIGGMQTILAGARMDATTDTSTLNYPVKPDNLLAACGSAGVSAQIIQGGTSEIEAARADAAKRPSGALFIDVLPPDAAQADGEIGMWQATVASTGGALVVASPNPSTQEYTRDNQLTPIVFWGRQWPAGLLVSRSTRRAGLIVNTDVAATIAGMAGARLPGPSYGVAATAIPASWNTVSRVLPAIAAQSSRQTRQQTWVPCLAVATAVLVALLVLLPARQSRPWRALVPATVALPLAMCFFPNAWEPPAAALAVLIVCWPLQPLLRRTEWPLLAVAAIGAAGIAADAVFNHALITSTSLLGYSPMEGARFYGLGNEAMGLLIGATVVISGALGASRRWTAAGGALWLVVAALLGVPTIGAKAGGLLVALVAFCAYLLASRSQTRTSRRALGISVAIAVAAGVGALVVLSRGGDSHVAHTLSEAHRFGAGVIWSVITRKSAMDLHLVLHSTWMLVLCAAGIDFARRWHSGGYPSRGIKRVLCTGAAATAASLLLNDAGVVAAALCIIFPWAYVLVADEKSEGAFEAAFSATALHAEAARL